MSFEEVDTCHVRRRIHIIFSTRDVHAGALHVCMCVCSRVRVRALSLSHTLSVRIATGRIGEPVTEIERAQGHDVYRCRVQQKYQHGRHGRVGQGAFSQLFPVSLAEALKRQCASPVVL